MVGAVSEVAVVDLEVVVAGAKKLWGDSWRGDFPTRGSRGLNFGEVSRRAHDTESSRPRAFLATDVNPWLHKKYKCLLYDAGQKNLNLRNSLFPTRCFLPGTLRM